jgi:hypothetical protein
MSAAAEPVLNSIHQGINMSNVENIERQIEALSPEELATLRAWFLEFDWAAWARQIEADIKAGKLDRFAQDAFRDHSSGRTTPL